MANPFKTGRQRTLSYSGTVVYLDSSNYGGSTPVAGTGMQWQMVVGSIIVTWNKSNGSPTSYTTDYFMEVQDTATGWNSSLVPPVPYHPPPPVAHAYTVTASWTISIDVEEWCDVYTPSSVTLLPSDNPATAYPTYAGQSAYADGLQALGVQFYELTRPGGTEAVSLTVSSSPTSPLAGTVSFTDTITTGNPVGYGPSYTGWNALIPAGAVSPGSWNLSSTMYWTDNWPSDVPGGVYYGSDPTGSSSVNITDGGTVVLNTMGTWPTLTLSYAEWNYSWNPNISYALQCRLRTFSSAYPASQYLGVNDGIAGMNVLCNPNGSYSWNQQAYAAAVTVFPPGSTSSVSVNQQLPVNAYLLNSSLASSGDDTRDWRTQFLGYQWQAFTLSRAGSFVIDPCTATTHWTVGSNTTLSISGGYLSAAVLGGVGSLTLTPPTTPAPGKQTWELYRYASFSLGLQIDAYSGSTSYVSGDLVSYSGGYYQAKGATTGNLPTNATYWSAYTPSFPYALTITIAGQTWSTQVGSSVSAMIVDGCCSNSETETVDTTQTRFPIISPGGYPTSYQPTSAYKMGWGINYASTVEISGIPSGMTLTLEGVSLVTSTDSQTQSQITFLAPFETWPTGWVNAGAGPNTTYVNPFIFVESDYRVSDWPAMAWVVPTVANSDYYYYYSITDMIAFLNYLPGLTLTPISPPSDTYHGNSLPAFLLAGQGATYNFNTASPTWQYWVDTSINQTIPAQDQWDEIQGYPGMGMVWTEGGTYGVWNVATPLIIGKFLRGEADGQVFKANDTPSVGASILSYVTATVANTGMATAGDLGQYYTGTPFGFGNVMTTTKLASTTYTSNRLWENRQRSRTSFRGKPTLTALAYDVSLKWIHARISSQVGSNYLQLGFAPNGNPYAWVDNPTTIESSQARIRWQDHLNDPLGIAYVPMGSGDTLNYLQTPNFGQTFGTPMTITSSLATNGFFDFDETADFRRWFYWLEGGSAPYTIWTVLYDHQGNIVLGPIATNLANADLLPVVVRWFPGTGNKFYIGLQYSNSGAVTYVTARDGINFS